MTTREELDLKIKRIEKKQNLKLPLTREENAILLLYGKPQTDAQREAKKKKTLAILYGKNFNA